MSIPKLSLRCPGQSTLPSVPFRFTDLPQELMNLIITHYYESYNLTTWMWEVDQTVEIIGTPSRNVELVSRKLQTDALLIFQKLFTGNLSVISHHKSGIPTTLSKFCTTPQAEWLMPSVKTLELPYLLHKWSTPQSDDLVKQLLMWFPRLEGIYSSCSVTKKDCIPDKFVQALADDREIARSVRRTFLSGKRDEMFAIPIKIVGLKELAQLLAANGGHDVKVFMDTHTRWGSCSHSVVISEQVRYQVTTTTRTTISRVWKQFGSGVPRLDPKALDSLSTGKDPIRVYCYPEKGVPELSVKFTPRPLPVAHPGD